MPILLHVDDLKPGMRLFQTVYRDNRSMLTAGQVLEEWQINSLRRRFPDLNVLVGDPVLDDWVEFDDDSHDREVAVSVHRQMGHLMSAVRNRLGNNTALQGADIAGLQRAIAEVLAYMSENPVANAMLIRLGQSKNYLQEHTGNVFYISLLVGNVIREYIYRERARSTHAGRLTIRYGMNLTPLALGCLFHDLGMIPLERLYQKSEPLSQEEMELVRAHPLAGADMLPREFDAVAKLVIRTHHENMDGTGYPAGLGKEQLHVFSRVIRVADALDAATSHQVYRKAKSAARALWEMTAGPYSKYYDPTVAKILIGLIQPFPIGAKIKLDCGRYGVVVRHNRKHPLRPTIIVAFDEEGKKLKRKQLQPPIDLAKHDEVRLVEFAGDDLSFLNEGPDESTWGELGPLDAEFDESLFELAYP